MNETNWDTILAAAVMLIGIAVMLGLAVVGC
jgi:hypothetical protein